MIRTRILALVALVVAFLGQTGCADSSLAPPFPISNRAPTSGGAPPQLPLADVAKAIERLVGGGNGDVDLQVGEGRELAALYQPGGYGPLWVDAEGRPGGLAREALPLLSGADSEGLDPEDYGAEALERRAARLAATVPPASGDVAGFDVRLSLGMLRYLRHLHEGRIDPRAVGFQMAVPAEALDFPSLLRSALADGRIVEAAADLTPPFPQYRRLRAILAQYRSLAANAPVEPLPPPGRAVRPGGSYTGVEALRRRLIALGDLLGDAAPPVEPTAYEGPLVTGVRRFQRRHGLAPDGVLGTQTYAALAVPIAQRVRQIELALERLRWLPGLRGRPAVIVNIPMFRLWAWDGGPWEGAPSFETNVIVGRAMDTPTPVVVEEMRYLTFRPYWDVPQSILDTEVLPALERDPEHLVRQGMEIVLGPGDEARAVPATAENLSLLRRGLLRVRQRPGPENALGLVKFIFPNNEQVFMHGTPAQELFGRTRRDFSHGCVRVESPVDLAVWVLKDRPEWTRDRILTAMAGPGPQQVNLRQPISVVLFYTTAAVVPGEDTIHFAEDIYEHDARMEQAFQQERPR